jgi:hypothetical protein
VRYVWRHLPLSDVHPYVEQAAEAAEAAAAQNAFWPMHDLLLTYQDALETSSTAAATTGPYDIASLSAAVRAAKAHSRLESLESA